MAKKKILVLDGHPYQKSFCAALAKSYNKGAAKSQHDVKLVNIRNLNFDLVLHAGYSKRQELEEELAKQQELIKWCEHLVIVTPVWWMSVPALLKGYFDRVLLPGFAFNYKKGKFFPHRHLKGRTSRVIYTQGSPGWVSKLLLMDSFWVGLKRGVLYFCGFSPVKRTVFAKVPSASTTKRKKWLKRAYKIGLEGK